MSNVLIGIIGVILFIGLALAGALILGDDFKTASSASQGAALMSQIKQASDAGMMWKLKTGRSQIPSQDMSFLVPRFLKTPAVNPTSLAVANPTNPFWMIRFDNNIHAIPGYEPVYASKYVYAVIGPQADAKSRSTCQAISETYGVQTIPDFGSNSDPHPTSESGCILGAGDIDGNGIKPYWIAYTRIAPATQSIIQPAN